MRQGPGKTADAGDKAALNAGHKGGGVGLLSEQPFSAMPGIRRVLKQQGSKLYLKGDGTFTSEFDEAIIVDTFNTALRLCRQFGLKKMELVLRVSGPDSDIATPMGDV